LVALATGGWFLQRGVGQEQNLYANERVFSEVLHYVRDGFVDSKQSPELYRMAIEGMLQELGDPHTSYLPAKDYENLRIQTQGEYGGLGISIGRRNGWVTVITPLPGTPGERAGLKAGDAIIEVEGESTKGWSDDQAVSRLRGPRGTKVALRVMRPGVDEPIGFEVVREEIHVRSVPAYFMLNPEVGYVELTVFSESSTKEVRDAILSLQKQGARRIVLDMRGNTGGLLEQGVSVSDLFLKDGQTVVETKGRVPNSNYRFSAETADEFPGLPIVLLVGPSSASATEIVAGALQDHDRALILGQVTYGKGSVQTVLKLSNNDWLKLTTGRWYTPSGRSIQGPYGIDQSGEPTDIDSPVTPTVETKDRPEFRTDAGRVVYGGGGIHPDLLITADTLSPPEKVLLQELQRQAADYSEARFAFGTAFASKHPELKPGFEVTEAMFDEFYAKLTSAGVKLDRETFNGGRNWIAREIASEVTISKFGREEWRKRVSAQDRQIKVAIELLQKASSPQGLFAAAADYERTMKTASGNGGNHP
jgi:carboxyl-terminal processing protease